MSDSFADLQKVFFAAFIQGVGYDLSQPAQVVQPAPPIVSDDDDEADALLWNYFNTIPEYSLTRNTTLSSGAQFLANYSAVMSSLVSPPNDFKKTIGDYCFDAYSNAVKNGFATASPKGYRDWAFLMSECSANADAGASAYARMQLNPIFAGQNNVLPYKPVGRKPVDFVPGYATMMKLLKKAPAVSFGVNLSTTDQTYKKTWTGGGQSAVFGLWSNSSSDTEICKKFSSAEVTMTASFKNLLAFKATPGDWYTSSAFGIAYHDPSAKVWSGAGQKTWDNTFSSRGDMQRFTTILLIANQMTLNYSTNATFSSSQQREIDSHKSAGLWPFYHSSSGGYSDTQVDFNTAGNLNVTVTTEKNVPTIIGAVVEPVDMYLGYQKDAARLLVASL